MELLLFFFFIFIVAGEGLKLLFLRVFVLVLSPAGRHDVDECVKMVRVLERRGRG